MAIVGIPAQLAPLTGGRSSVEVDGSNVRQLIDRMDEMYPGIRDQLVENGRLRGNISVAIDGEISPLGLLERVSARSEVHFVAAISGGAIAEHSA